MKQNKAREWARQRASWRCLVFLQESFEPWHQQQNKILDRGIACEERTGYLKNEDT
jgi:hypothetical protein